MKEFITDLKLFVKKHWKVILGIILFVIILVKEIPNFKKGFEDGLKSTESK